MSLTVPAPLTDVRPDQDPAALGPAALGPAALDPAALDPAALDPAALDPAAAAARRRAMSAHPAGTGRLSAGSLRVESRFPTQRDVHSLAAARHPLSVSVLLATTPADRMVPSDARELDRLVAHAERRLMMEADAVGVARVRAALAAAVARAIDGPTDRGLAILASPEQVHVHLLRVRPVERVVLDPTFATRDLVRSAAEDPPFLLLVLDHRAARIFHYDQRFCRPVLGHDFPVLRPENARWDRTDVGAADRSRREHVRSFLRRVDTQLAARLAQQPLPVVLVASHRTAAEFDAVSRGRRIAAVIRSNGARMPLEELERRARAALSGHLSDRAAAALDTARSRLRAGRAVAGLAGAWEALYDEPHMLVVESSLSAAVHMAPDGSWSPAADPDEPGVIDDAVDELIEAVMFCGAEVVIVPDGSLTQHGRLVLVTRGPVRRSLRFGGIPVLRG